MSSGLRVHAPPRAAPLAGDAARLAKFCRGSLTTRSFIILPHAGSNNIPAAVGEPATYARAHSKCCWPSVVLKPLRDLLMRVFSQQNPDGDWPQWFMFFERERNIRAGDSHGDIVFWPVLALAQYLLASEDSSILDEIAPFFAETDGTC